MSDLSPELRARILHLLRERVNAAEIARHTGATRARIGAINAHLTRGTYEKVQNVEMLNELEASTETTFRLERDLQNALRRNIAELERGLSIIDDGKERKVPAGFIDITARDRDFPAWAARSGRHDQAFEGLRGGGGRRADGAGAAGS